MGLIYYITIPSMYLFLVIYSVFNLNVVSWGTREVITFFFFINNVNVAFNVHVQVPKKKTAEEMEQEKLEAEKAAQAPPKKKSGLAAWCCGGDNYLQYMVSNFFSDRGGMKGYLEGMNDRLDQIEMALNREGYEVPKKPEGTVVDAPKKAVTVKRNPTVRIVEPEKPPRDDMKNPAWIEDKGLGDGVIKRIPNKEVTFWNQLIEKYLKPLEKNADKEKEVAKGLLELRDKVVFSFLMINSIWVITVFLMQENKDLLFIEWPWGPKVKCE